MKIEIPTKILTNGQRGNIIARNEKIPESRLFFEVDSKYAGLISNLYNAYNSDHFTIDNEKMFMDSYVSWEPRGTYGKIEPATRIAEKYASGEIALGGSVDTIFAEIQLKEAEKQEQLREEARIEKENAAKELIEKPLREAREKIAAEEKKRTDEEQKLRVEEENKKNAADKEAERQKMLAWAQEHGSDRLKKGLRQGYRCNKLYQTEYGAWLIANDSYEYDFKDIVSEKDHACPTLEALEEVERVQIWDGVTATIVYLPEGLTELHKVPDEYDEPEGGCEAVRVDVKGTAGYWYRTF